MLIGENAAYLEEVLRQYLADPASVEPSWRAWFEGEGRDFVEASVPPDGPTLAPRGVFDSGAAAPVDINLEVLKSQGRIFQLINAYRVRGHLKARLDPLGIGPTIKHPELDPAYWGFTEADYDRTFSTASLSGPQSMTLRNLHAWLNETYSRTIGCEFMHIHDVRIKNWLQERFEQRRNHCDVDHDTQLFLYEELRRAEAFEDFLHVKFRGAKRFSLEGAEAMIPLIGLIIEDVTHRGVEEVVIGMAHRGRLNVLSNVMGKLPRRIFSEFDDNTPESMLGRGDVKYHLGYSSDRETRHGDKVHLSLTFNPSHLEAINPVVEGKVRAKQDRYRDLERTRIMPILIHGDAAFAGQGLVAETLNMSGLEGYHIGGTVHIIVNNQIGFTTLPSDSRSTPYCTDIARMVQIPIMHVNGEDPEAVAQVARIAAEFRQTFHRDVVIDMYCFRRYGHNEADEPAFTQPIMYDAIRKHPKVHEVYRDVLLDRGQTTEEELDAIDRANAKYLEEELAAAREDTTRRFPDSFSGVWKGYIGGPDSKAPIVDTKIDQATYERVLTGLTVMPEGVHIHPRLKRLVAKRASAMAPDQPVDWGLGELLAYGSLVLDGAPVRITGQDVIRGTFSHRHAGFFAPEDASKYLPLQHLSEDQGRFEVYNSLLSEFAVVGFEYGYALDSPEALVIWEAQFGD
ncbi:MAG: 2-oxoglutarate dehydrogenase E1 component, partial [Myxococcota bacterium]